MIEDVEITNFRGIDSLKVEDLRRVNIFVGKNSSGKTSVLEAIHASCNATHPSQLVVVGQQRGQVFVRNNDTFLRSFFYGMDLKNTPKIKLVTDEGSHDYSMSIQSEETVTIPETSDDLANNNLGSDIIGKLNIDFEHKKNGESPHSHSTSFNLNTGQVDNSFHCDRCIKSSFVGVRSVMNMKLVSQEISKLRRMKQQRKLAGILESVNPKIEALEPSTESGIDSVNVDLGLDTLLPVQILGDGFNRTLQYAIELVKTDVEVLVIDEIDSGLHYSVMENLWKQIVALLKARPTFQLFCSTHSDDMVCAAVSAFEDTPEDFSVYRMTKKNNNIIANKSDFDLTNDMCSGGFEIR